MPIGTDSTGKAIAARPLRIAEGQFSTDEAGRAVQVMPIRYVPQAATTNEAGRAVEALQAEIVADAIVTRADGPVVGSSPARVVEGLTTTDAAGLVVPVVPVLDIGFGAGNVLTLDFEQGRYRDASGFTTDVSTISTYTRSGSKHEAPPLTAFAADAPGIIPGVGYYSRGAFTNKNTNTAINPADEAGLAAAGTATITHVARASLPPAVAAALDTFDPSGIVTALLRIEAPAASDRVSFPGTVGNLNVHTLSIFAYVVSGDWTLQLNVGTGSSALQSGFARTSAQATPDATTRVLQVFCSGGGGDIYVLGNNMTETTTLGPVLPASGASGADNFSFTVENGDYTATYTFDDDTTQAIPTTVVGGTYTLLTTELNRPLVKRVALAV